MAVNKFGTEYPDKPEHVKAPDCPKCGAWRIYDVFSDRFICVAECGTRKV